MEDLDTVKCQCAVCGTDLNLSREKKMDDLGGLVPGILWFEGLCPQCGTVVELDFVRNPNHRPTC